MVSITATKEQTVTLMTQMTHFGDAIPSTINQETNSDLKIDNIELKNESIENKNNNTLDSIDSNNNTN